MKLFFKILSFVLLLAPAFVLAEYQPLVGIPGIETNDPYLNFETYLQAIYATSISLAALLAVIKIVIAGVKWMTTDIVTSKGDAKKDIEGAVFGLLVILGAVLILYIINPNIGTVDLTLTKAQPPSGNAAGSAQTAIEICKDNADTCKTEMVSCKTLSDQYQEGPGQGANQYYSEGVFGQGKNYDCSSAEERCRGDLIINNTGSGGTCLTTDAQVATALPTLAIEYCPAGKTCSASACPDNPSLFGSCEADCTVGKNERGGIFDPATDACITIND